ncbi:MAG: Plug domain-containing protein, partial [bacterium]
MIKYYIGMVLAGQLALGPIVAQAQTGTITGIVRVSGTVVIDAEVRLRELGLRTKVDGTGRFLLEGVSQGEYILEGESPRWGRGAQSVTVRSEETTELVLELEAVFHLGELLVTTAPGAVRQDRAYQATTVVTSRDLLKLGAMSLGETLSKQPGLSSTYFGPGSSRPIIRGLSGDRVRILQNGLS